MSGITRYILRQLTVGMIFVAIGFACVLWLTQSLRFVEMIINKGLSIGSFLHLTMLVLPNFLTIILPISLFSVVLFTYNKLTMDRELVVMRSAGISQWALARPALILALASTFIGYALNLYIIPKSVESFRELQWSIRNDISGLLLQEGAFNQISEGLTIYVRARSAEGELMGIIVHDQRKPDKPATMMAERGALVHTDQGPRVLMVNGNRQQVTKGTGKMSLLYFDTYTVDFGGGAADSEGSRFRDQRERSLHELFSASKETLGEVDFRRFRVEAHQRLASPLYHVTFAIIGLACLLSGSFNRRGQTGRVVAAIALMVLIQAGSLGASNLATNRLYFIPLIYLNAILPIVLGAWYITSPPRRRPRPVPAPAGGAD